MLARMVRAQPGTPLGLRNRAILLAGFGGALRRSEIVGLDAGDLELVDGRGVVLTVRRSKTDQHGAGAAVAIWRSDDPDLCAPTALRRWLEHRAARHSDDLLFVGLRAGGVMTATRLSDKAVVRLGQGHRRGGWRRRSGAGRANLRGARRRRHPQLLRP